MTQAVVDASVAAKWVVQEAHSDRAALLLAFDARHAPDHWRVEAINVLWSKILHGDLTAADAEERMAVLSRAPIIETPIAILMPRAFQIAVAHMVTIHDALYVALAAQRDLPFVTADKRLIRRLSGAPALARLMVWVGSLAA
ncbi:MAG: type II toxin-antitoxin system VapC family toxin [Acetobacteraceae bacterium]|nr:type II toxin-antitoxin system VapC family toxin [Pseudomonadota bacterium]